MTSRLWPGEVLRAVCMADPALVVIVVKRAHVDGRPNRASRPVPLIVVRPLVPTTDAVRKAAT